MDVVLSVKIPLRDLFGFGTMKPSLEIQSMNKKYYL